MEDQGGKPGVFVVAGLDELRGEVGCAIWALERRKIPIVWNMEQFCI